MLWVAFDRGLRLAEKRCFPCPNRGAWLQARDELYEEIMTKGRSYIKSLVRRYANASQAIPLNFVALSKVTRVATTSIHLF